MKFDRQILKSIQKLAANIFGWAIFLGGLYLGIAGLFALVSAIVSGKIELIFSRMILPVAAITIVAMCLSTAIAIIKPRRKILTVVQKISRKIGSWMSFVEIVLLINVGLFRAIESGLVRSAILWLVEFIVSIIELTTWAIALVTCLGFMLFPISAILSYRAKTIERKGWSLARRERVDRIDEIRRSRLERGLFVPNGLADPVDEIEYVQDRDWMEISDDEVLGIGDLSCGYNARSLFLRCAVHPNVDTCEGCHDYRPH
jgi:Family of unknown function (DUF6464)